MGKFIKSADSDETFFASASVVAFAILAVPHRWLLRPRVAPFGLGALALVAGLIGFRAVFAVRNSVAGDTPDFGWILYCSFFVVACLNVECARRRFLSMLGDRSSIDLKTKATVEDQQH